jgi:hypothetical protein
MFSGDTTNEPATRLQAEIQINKGSMTSIKTTKTDKGIQFRKMISKMH